jgi:hypothetical protein
MRRRVHARLVRSSVRRGTTAAEGQTLLFEYIVNVETGELIRDHVWLPVGPWWPPAGTILRGDMVEFDVTIGPVVKGYLGYRWDKMEELPPPRVDPQGFYDPANLKKVGV